VPGWSDRTLYNQLNYEYNILYSWKFRYDWRPILNIVRIDKSASSFSILVQYKKFMVILSIYCIFKCERSIYVKYFAPDYIQTNQNGSYAPA
jgi:hypothetical protein